MLSYVDEVFAIFKQYMDENDNTFVSDTDASRYLSMGYNEFRKKVTTYDKHFYAVSQTYNPGGAYSLNLATVVPIIMGDPGTLTAPRLSQLISVSYPDPVSGEPMDYFIPLNGPENATCGRDPGYYLRGTVLRFDQPVSQTLRIDYVPVSSVNWTKTTTTPPREWIDELVEYHDIIALLAYQQYAIRDSRQSENITIALNKRLMDLVDYLSSGRDMRANKTMILSADPSSVYGDWSY